jgi:hypothetical protein
VLELSWNESLFIGFYPFLIGDGLKIAAGTAVYSALKRYRPEFIYLPEDRK